MALLMTIMTKLNDKGIKQAERGLKSLTHSLKSGIGLGLGALGLGFSVQQLGEMARQFNEDEKAAKLLSDQLHRMAGATKVQSDGAEAFIQKMQLQTGVLDDQLRPALVEYAASTKDVKEAQKLLVAGMDIAAGRGRDIASVQKAITKSYSGNITVLQRMFPEMKKFADAYKATKGHALTFAESVDLGRKMIKKMAEDNKGQAAAMATPFDRMNAAVDNLKESIGGALMPMIEKILPGVQGMVTAIATPGSKEQRALEKVGKAFADAATSVSTFFSQFDPDKQSGFVGAMKILQTSTTWLGAMAEVGPAIDYLKNNPNKTLDPKKFPMLSGISKSNAKASSTLRELTKGGQPNPWGLGMDIQKPSSQYQKNIVIQINGVVGDKVAVGKAVKEAMKAYESRNN